MGARSRILFGPGKRQAQRDKRKGCSPRPNKGDDDGAKNKPPPIEAKLPGEIILGKAIAGIRDKEANTAETDKEKLQGVWKLVRVEALGQTWRGEKFNCVGNLGIEGDRLFSPDREMPESTWGGTFKLDAAKKPKRITIFDEGPNGPLKFNGIYSIDGDELKLCLNEDGTNKAIPTEFKTKPGSPFILTTFKRGAIKQVEVIANNKNAAQTDKDKLQGIWKLVRLEALGKVFGADKLSEIGDLGIRGDRLYNLNPYAPQFCSLTNSEAKGKVQGHPFPGRRRIKTLFGRHGGPKRVQDGYTFGPNSRDIQTGGIRRGSKEVRTLLRGGLRVSRR